MDYGFGKTYTLPGKFTALNGCIQYYKLTSKVDLVAASPVDANKPTAEELKAIAEAQANYLRVLEILRTYGGQPVITKAEGKVVEFTLEQANVYGKAGQMQPSEKDLINEAKAKIAELFKNIKAIVFVVDENGHVVSEDVESETTDLFESVEIKEAF